MRQLKCADVWGGIKNQDLDVRSAGLTASLYSSAANGGKGGDAYYFSLCCADCLTRIAIADVVGHGEQVSAVGQWVYDRLAEHMNDLDQPGLLGRLNRTMMEKGLTAMTTAVVMSYYLSEGKLYLSYAGHPPLYASSGSDVWRALPLPRDLMKGDNLPLGVMKNARYDMGSFPFQPGDRFLLYSDGVIETPNPRGELLGAQRLADALNAAGSHEPAAIKQDVLRTLHAWSGNGLGHDDVTLIAVELNQSCDSTEGRG